MSKRSMINKTSSVHDLQIELLQDQQTAAAYLKVALDEYQEDGNTEVFLLALRNVAEARGGIGKLAQKTHLNRQSLYQTLSSRGNPRLDTLGKVLLALGFHLSIEAINDTYEAA